MTRAILQAAGMGMALTFAIPSGALGQDFGILPPDLDQLDITSLREFGQRAGWTFDVKDSWVTWHLRSGGSITDVTGLKVPDNWMDLGIFMDVGEDSNLPASFDWRTEIPGGLQPIRNQGKCGSCWAFSITATVESLVKIQDPLVQTNLAEQTLVSECSDAGSCSGGYFTGFDYIRENGLPDEENDPYMAQDTSCRQGLKPSEKILSWAYIAGRYGSPSIEQLKTAIYKYGPISVTVNANSFGAYSSGIFNACKPSPINHMVNLEGWHDAPDGKGYWIMRNSWGSHWGEGGYMRIRYTDANGNKCNNIGETAAFAVLLNR